MTKLLIRVYARNHLQRPFKKPEHMIFVWFVNVGRYQVCIFLGRWDFPLRFYMNVTAPAGGKMKG